MERDGMVRIAVVGGSGSGKSTLAKRLAANLGDRGCLLRVDDYYRDLTPAQTADIPGVDFDAPEAIELTLLAAHLRELRDGRPVTTPIYDPIRSVRTGETRAVPAAPCCLVEGLFLPPEVDFELVLYVDTPPDIALCRRLDRVLRSGGEVMGEVERWQRWVHRSHHVHVVPLRKRADVVLDGLLAPDALADLAWDWLTRRLGLR